jgi:uncharacterized protein (DUF983 family)
VGAGYPRGVIAMARVIPTKMWLLVELARARAVWPDIKISLEFKIALSLFLLFTIGVAVLGFLR